MKKRILIITIVLLVSFSTFAFAVANDIISQLQLQQQTAKTHILNNFAGDWTSGDSFVEDTGGSSNPNSVYEQLKQFRIPKSSALSSIINGNKTETTKELCQYVKDYVTSSEFIENYKQKREKSKPTSEPYRPDAATINAQKKALKETEANIAKMRKMLTKEQLAQMEKGIADMKKQIADWDDPTPNKTRWEKMYPENPQIIVKKRLEEYLAIAATVDFNAQLTGAGKNQKFAKPEYESKSLKWKAIYRAGKDVNDVVTIFVKDWLKELNASVK